MAGSVSSLQVQGHPVKDMKAAIQATTNLGFLLRCRRQLGAHSVYLIFALRSQEAQSSLKGADN